MIVQEPPTEPEVRASRVSRPDPQPRRRLPLMTLGLIGANLLMAFAQWAASGYPLSLNYSNEFADWALGAKVPSLVASGEYWRLVTANFLHGSLFPHLLLNMLGLLVLGRLIESFYGRLRMFVIYTLACVAGALLSYQLTRAVSLGASTGIMGLMGALLLHNWKYRQHLPPHVNRVFPLLMTIVLMQFFIDALFQSSIDVAGHLGGLLGGAAVASLLESRIAGPMQNERDWLPLPTAVTTAVLLLAYGAYGLISTLPAQTDLLRLAHVRDLQEQARQLRRVVEKRPYFLEARLVLIQTELENNDLEAGRQEYLNLLRQDPTIRSAPNAERVRERMALTYLQQSMIAYRRGRWELALAAGDGALALDPSKPVVAQASNQTAWILVDKLERDLKRAEKLALQATGIEPEEPAFIDTLAWVYYKQGRYQEALHQQLRALNRVQGQPGLFGNAEYYYHLGAIYEKLGNTAQATANYKQALAGQGRYPEAAEGLRRVAPGEAPPPMIQPPPRRRRDPVEERGLI